MPLLISLVNYLNEDERRRFASIPLAGQEKRIRDYLLLQKPGLLAKQRIMRETGISSTHYDKICALLLKKAYRSLAGESELEQLNFLSRKFMFGHLFHEIKQLKPRLSQMTSRERQQYRRVFFDLSINVPARYFEEHFVLQNADEYLREVDAEREVHEWEVKAKLLFARLNLLIQKPPQEEAHRQILREIEALDHNVAVVKNPGIRSILLHIWINYYRSIEVNRVRRSWYVGQMAGLYGGEDKLPVYERAVAGCHQAEMLFEEGLYEKACNHYGNTFSHYLPVLRNQFHHMARWIELTMLLGSYDKARHLLDTHFRVYVDNRHESNGVLGSMLYAQLFLFQGHLKEAFECIGMAKSLNSIQVYFSYEVRIRLLEALFFAFSGDYEFVARLAMRNIRYIQLQKIPLRNYRYAHFFYLLKEIRSVRTGTQIPDRLKVFMQEFESGYDLIYGKLYKQLLVQQ